LDVKRDGAIGSGFLANESDVIDELLEDDLAIDHRKLELQ